MSPGEIAAAIVTVIVAVGGVIVTIIAAVGKMRRDVLDSTREIYSKVDGTASELREEVQALHRQVTALQERRVDDAKAQIAVAATVPAATPVLTDIATHTKETAENTR